MDGIYRVQRHIYDFTRKPYLLGRDIMLRELLPPSGGSLLEVGCGTARNLICAARLYPKLRCFGFDVSKAMLETAAASIVRTRLTERISLALADADAFEPKAAFGVARFDRIVISYALSMIPGWEAVLEAALDMLEPEGVLLIVDFGDQNNLPRWFRMILFAWLRLFSVTPRLDLSDAIKRIALNREYKYQARRLYGGYAILAIIHSSEYDKSAE
jgi:S-adenosylmethionine-diacylgycerolhomoserine-N-methlytransferase